MSAGLLLCATTAVTVWAIVVDFQTHASKDSKISDCYSTVDDGKDRSDVSWFFGLAAVTKICVRCYS